MWLQEFTSITKKTHLAMELDNCGEKCSMLFPTQLTTQL